MELIGSPESRQKIAVNMDGQALVVLLYIFFREKI
jgi:hypothetical protein